MIKMYEVYKDDVCLKQILFPYLIYANNNISKCNIAKFNYGWNIKFEFNKINVEYVIVGLSTTTYRPYSKLLLTKAEDGIMLFALEITSKLTLDSNKTSEEYNDLVSELIDHCDEYFSNELIKEYKAILNKENQWNT